MRLWTVQASSSSSSSGIDNNRSPGAISFSIYIQYSMTRRFLPRLLCTHLLLFTGSSFLIVAARAHFPRISRIALSLSLCVCKWAMPFYMDPCWLKIKIEAYMNKWCYITYTPCHCVSRFPHRVCMCVCVNVCAFALDIHLIAEINYILSAYLMHCMLNPQWFHVCALAHTDWVCKSFIL